MIFHQTVVFLVLRVTFAVLMALDIYVAVKVGKLPIFMPKVELKSDDSKAKDATYDKGCTDLKFAISVIIAIFGNHLVLHIF